MSKLWFHSGRNCGKSEIYRATLTPHTSACVTGPGMYDAVVKAQPGSDCILDLTVKEEPDAFDCVIAPYILEEEPLKANWEQINGEFRLDPNLDMINADYQGITDDLCKKKHEKLIHKPQTVKSPLLTVTDCHGIQLGYGFGGL